MRYALIALLLVALVVEVYAVYWMSDGAPESAPPAAVIPAGLPEADEGLPIGTQLAAREQRLAAEQGEPVWPRNPNKGDRVIRGFVYRFGQPVAGAVVTIDQRPLDRGVDPSGYVGQPRWTDRTGLNGYFEVDTLPEGSFVVQAREGGGLAMARVDLTEEILAHETMLGLKPAQPVAGIVTAPPRPAPAPAPAADARPAPTEELRGAIAEARNRELASGAAPNALVFAIPASAAATQDDDGLMAFLPVRTGPDGRFAFDLLPGPCRFVVNAQGHDPWISPLAPPGAQDLNLQLVPGGGVAGQVTHAETGEPVSQVDVSLRPVNTPLARQLAWTDAHGAFSFAGLPAGQYALTVESDKFVLAEAPAPVRVWPGKETGGAALSVTGAAAMRGRVVGPGGADLHDIAVRVAGSGTTRVFKTDTAGYFQAAGLAAGEYTLDLPGLGGFTVEPAPPARVEVSGPGVNAGPTFRVLPAPGKGKAILLAEDADGARITGAAIHYFARPVQGSTSPPDDRLEGTALTDAEGRFVWDGVPLDWEFRAYASTPGRVSDTSPWRRLEGASAELVLTVNRSALGRIAGTVVDSLERPVPGAAVSVLQDGGDTPWPRHRTAWTNTAGEFEVAGCPEGSYRLEVGTRFGPDGRVAQAKKSSEVAVGPEADVTGVRIMLP